MEKMERLCTMVRRILIDNPGARDSDEKLISLLIKQFYPDRDCKISEVGYTTLKLPSFESITRARRKVQEKDESLRGSAPVRGRRRTEELEMEAWAVNG